MSAVLYSTNCPKCMILEKMLDKKGVEYKKCTDMKEIRSKGIMSAPTLEMDGKLLSYDEAMSEMQNLA